MPTSEYRDMPPEDRAALDAGVDRLTRLSEDATEIASHHPQIHAALAAAREEGRLLGYEQGRSQMLALIEREWVNCVIVRDTRYSGINPRQSANHYRMELCHALLTAAGIEVQTRSRRAEEARDDA